MREVIAEIAIWSRRSSLLILRFPRHDRPVLFWDGELVVTFAWQASFYVREVCTTEFKVVASILPGVDSHLRIGVGQLNRMPSRCVKASSNAVALMNVTGTVENWIVNSHDAIAHINEVNCGDNAAFGRTGQ